MSKLKIGFEITDNWNIMAFRNVIKALQNEPTIFHPSLTEVELYLISNDDSSAYIYLTGQNIGLDTDHVIVTHFSSDKVTTIESYNIDVYFDNLQAVIELLDATDTYGVLVNSIQDMYHIQPKWITTFRNTLIRIFDEEATKTC